MSRWAPHWVLRKVYYANALHGLPSARTSIEKQLAAGTWSASCQTEGHSSRS
jgi:hypothetical protein